MIRDMFSRRSKYLTKWETSHCWKIWFHVFRSTQSLIRWCWIWISMVVLFKVSYLLACFLPETLACWVCKLPSRNVLESLFFLEFSFFKIDFRGPSWTLGKFAADSLMRLFSSMIFSHRSSASTSLIGWTSITSTWPVTSWTKALIAFSFAVSELIEDFYQTPLH